MIKKLMLAFALLAGVGAVSLGAAQTVSATGGWYDRNGNKAKVVVTCDATTLKISHNKGDTWLRSFYVGEPLPNDATGPNVIDIYGTGDKQEIPVDSKDVKVHYWKGPNHSNGYWKEVHVKVDYEAKFCPGKVTFDKVWQGDAEGDVTFEYKLGSKRSGWDTHTAKDGETVVVPFGKTLKYLGEEASVPENCEFSSTVELSGDFSDEGTLKAKGDYHYIFGQSKVGYVTVTNDVECEEDEVTTTVTKEKEEPKEEQVEAPVGAVDAGAGPAATALLGSLMSVGTIGAGVIRRKSAELFN